MKRHSCAEYRAEHNFVGNYIAGCGVERCRYFDLTVIECLAYFVGHNLAYSFKIAAESEHVVLNVDITQLHHVLTDDRMIVVEVYYLHGCYCLVTVLCCYERPFSAIRS